MGGDHSVLVVDDEPSIRLLCKVNLELEGFRVLEAETLDEARELLRGERVSVVLLDVHVGSEDGRILLEEIRAEQPALPVALFSGTAGSDAIEEEGADAVIPKPFPLELLVDTVSHLATRAYI